MTSSTPLLPRTVLSVVTLKGYHSNTVMLKSPGVTSRASMSCKKVTLNFMVFEPKLTFLGWIIHLAPRCVYNYPLVYFPKLSPPSSSENLPFWRLVERRYSRPFPRRSYRNVRNNCITGITDQPHSGTHSLQNTVPDWSSIYFRCVINYMQ